MCKIIFTLFELKVKSAIKKKIEPTELIEPIEL